MRLSEPISMPESEVAQVEELRKLLQLGSPEFVGPDGTERIPLPPSIYKILKDVVGNMQRGRSIVLLPEDKAFTTQSAADFLGVSRPHFIKLLEEHRIPFHRTGSHRRVAFKDLVTYAKARDAERSWIINELAKEAFTDGLYNDAKMPEGGEDE
jgi:excisionase family DNA binding protein